MAAIHIVRDHTLGLPRAREIAIAWAEKAEADFDMDCALVEGEDADTLAFSRSGVKGELRITADRFELDAKLGLLLGVLSKKIESEIERTLDDLLAADK